MIELVDELLDYFNMNDLSEEYPYISVYHSGRFIEGIISDELYGILIALKEAKEDADE